MGVGVVADQDAAGLEGVDDVGVGLEHVLPGPLGDVGGEATAVVDRHHQPDAVFDADPLVVLAEAGSDVDHAGALVDLDEVGADDAERVGLVAEVGEQRLVGAADQVATLDRAGRRGAFQLGRVPLDGGLGEVVADPVLVHRLVGDVGADGQRQVGRQGPRCGGPGQDALGRRVAGAVGLEAERDGDGRILAGPGGVVDADLEVGQRRLGRPTSRA